MTISGEHSGPSSAWESLTPWEKAKEWQEANPELANEIISMGRARATMVWQLEREEAEHRHLLDLAEMEHRHALEARRSEQIALSGKRLWITQMVALFACVASIGLNGILSYRYAQFGNPVPGLAVFGAGGLVTGGAYLVSRTATQQLTSPEESTVNLAKPSPPS